VWRDWKGRWVGRLRGVLWSSLLEIGRLRDEVGNRRE
jgi:hypothetical protein